MLVHNPAADALTRDRIYSVPCPRCGARKRELCVWEDNTPRLKGAHLHRVTRREDMDMARAIQTRGVVRFLFWSVVVLLGILIPGSVAYALFGSSGLS